MSAAAGAGSTPRPAHAALTIAAWLVALALGALVIARGSITSDLSAFLPSHPQAAQRLLIEQLRAGVASRMLFIGIEGGAAASRAQASRELAALLRADPRFEQVHNGQRNMQEAGTWLAAHRYELSPAITPERFTPAGLREAIGDTLALLGTPAGAAIKPLLDRDPTGETMTIAEGLLPERAPRVEQGVWVSRSAPRAVLLAIAHASGSDLDAQAAALQALHAAFAKAAAPGLRLEVTGAPVFAVASRATIEAEVRRLALFGSLAVGGLLLAAFASLSALLVAALPVVGGIVGGIAAVNLAFGTVHGITLAFGSTLIGESVDYAIYYLIQARGAGGGKQGGWRHWLKGGWPTLRLGLLTSICGFAALLFSGFAGLQQLGVFSIAGLACAALVARYLLPVLVPDGAHGQGLRRPLARTGGRVLAAMPRLRHGVIALGIVAAAVLVWRGGGIWRGDLASLSPVPRDMLALDAGLRADLGASDAGVLVVASGADLQAALRAAEAAAPRLDALVDRRVLAGYETPTRLLPSQATQAARRAALPDAAQLRSALDAATQGGPLKAERLAPFIDEVQRARSAPPLTLQDVHASPLGAALQAMLLPRAAGGWSALINLQAPPGQEIDAARVRQALAGLAPDVQVLAVGAELRTLYDRYLNQALLQALLGALAVVVVLAWQLRSPRRLLAVCEPLALAVLLTLGGLVVAGVPLGILHLVGLLLVVAVGSNYALFFDAMTTTRDGQSGAMTWAREDTLASLLLANLTTVVSFGLLAISDIPALAAIGRVVAPGALLALLLAAAFVRGRQPQTWRSCDA